MRSEIGRIAEVLIAAGLNGVVQGVLVLCAVALALRAVGRINAATRHAVWLVTLALIAALIPAQLLRDYLASKVNRPKTARHASPPAPASDPAPLDPKVALSSASSSKDSSTEPQLADRSSERALPVASNTGESAGLGRPEAAQRVTGSVSSLLSGSPLALPLSTGAGQADRGSIGRSVFRRLIAFFGSGARFIESDSWAFLKPGSVSPSVAMGLLLAGLGVAAVKMSVLLRRLMDLRQLKRSSVLARGFLSALFEKLRLRLDVRRKVELKLSPQLQSPVILGFVHPVVLLPAGEADRSDPRLLEHILQHELAHVARRDDWTTLGQNLIQATLFFHPAIWWVSRRLSLEREIACDDHVLRQGCRPRAYALLLANVASRMAGHRPLLAPGVSTNKNQLTKRIDMILDTHRNISPRLAKARLGFLTGAAVLTAALALCTAPRLVLAQNSVHPPSAVLAPAPAPLLVLGPGAVVPPSPDLLPAPAIVAGTPSPGAAYEPPEVPAPVPPAPPEADQGPKYKPDYPDQPALPPVTTAPPAAAPALPPVAIAPPSLALAPVAGPVIAAFPQPEAVPTPPVAVTPAPRAPRDKRLADENRSFEARLRRVERMVESLMAQENPKHASRNFDYRDKQPGDAEVQARAMQEFNQQVERQVAQAAEQAKRAAEQADRAMRVQRDWQGQEKGRDASVKELEALRKAREALGREMERLDRQIQRLEQDRERSKPDRERLEKDKKLRDESQDKSAEEEGTAETAAVGPLAGEAMP